VLCIFVNSGSYSKQYGNSEVPEDMTDIAIGAISKIGGPIRLMPLDMENLQKLVIYGSLTEYDRSLQNSKGGVDANADYLSSKTRINTGTTGQVIYEDRPENDGGISASHNKLKNVSRMTMDFRVVRMNEGGMINTASVVTNTILLYQTAETKSFGINLNGKSLGLLSTFGATGALGYSDSMTEVDARHAAIRILIERSIMDLLGKEYKLPYWRCHAKEITKEVIVNGEKQKKTRFEIDRNRMYELDDKDNDDVVINLIKRYYNKDDYRSTTAINFFERPTSIENNKRDKKFIIDDTQPISSNKGLFISDDIRKEIQKFIDQEKKNQKQTTIAEKWVRELKSGKVYNDKDFKREWWQKEITNRKIHEDDVTLKKRWIEDLEEKIGEYTECKAYVFISDIYYTMPTPEDYVIPIFPKELEARRKYKNPYHYAQIKTKQCLMSQIIDAYGKKFEEDAWKNKREDYNKGNINETDFFTNLWLNLPINQNKKWENE
jgi:hypothetical protein